MKKKLNVVMAGVVKELSTKQYQRDNLFYNRFLFNKNLSVFNIDNRYEIKINSVRGYSGLMFTIYLDSKKINVEYAGVKPKEWVQIKDLVLCSSEEEYFMQSTIMDYTEIINLEDMVLLHEFLLRLEKKKRYGKI